MWQKTNKTDCKRMKTLTDKELELMNILWEKGPQGMRDLYNATPEPRSHFNTISTMIHRLEEHGMVKHRAVSLRVYLYEAAMSREDYQMYAQKDAIDRAFGGSYMNFISKLVEHEEISIDELKELIAMVTDKSSKNN